ncbi:MAG: phosphoribosylanthranilate isomerase [Xanthobacteraceae bacterium]|nr:phosphoribosylanthranilate isomerase [Xanthobacteraceae bacterium]
MIVKICGIKDLAAMDAALEAGADMVGLVFFPASPRNVTPVEAEKLAARARGKAKVIALSVDADDTLIDAIEASVAPDMHQLHGSETAARVSELRTRTKKEMMKAIPVASASDLAPLASYEEVADWILFDAKAPKDATRPGGHGQAFDWSLLKNIKHTKPMMLSGGINPGNVASAIETVRPDAVDVSSGVESAPGVKDREKVFAFVRAARGAAMEKAS